MKKLAVAIAYFLVLASVPLVAQSNKIAPLGVWRGTLDGLPGVTLTLANDTGEIGGTVVFYGINGEARQIVIIEPHTLLHPKLDGDTLSFQIKFGGDRTGLARVTVVFSADNKAQIHCLDCGPDSPTTELIRQTD
ncbi:hypothetical protein EDE15_1991 [Edaphobacter aggregans]|uniref:Uncharacterized protein n=1 Tax=Edaphobacter aggregans TaxID=570835 RepID=A0A3R9PRU3_9BACT|nr:hypothetical protein [Edaphobacter aggregans]RSL16475.1 hypothetical protein EDE15_1991 [Edaphobacter aggregans]